jgi:hypothetical protein
VQELLAHVLHGLGVHQLEHDVGDQLHGLPGKERKEGSEEK